MHPAQSAPLNPQHTVRAAGDDEGTAGERYWEELTKAERRAAELLGYTEEEWDEEEGESEETEDEDDDVEPGQDLTLSWPLGQDPCKITWPF